MSLCVQKVNSFTPPNNYQSNSRKSFFQTNPKLFYHLDVFAKSKKYISFGTDKRENFIKWVNDVKTGIATILGTGWQGIFYRVDNQTGMKVPKPKFPELLGADINGYNNVREHFILNKIHKIDKNITAAPIDLEEKDGKYYLMSQIINGVHPTHSGLTENHLRGIINKSFTLDINGIVHTDLQNQNIILENEFSEKFIDFGAYNILTNHGNYIDSNNVDYHQFMDDGWVERETNSDFKQKFIKTFYSNNQKYDIKNYSDNPYLKIKSNISNFEFRSIYDYLMQNDISNPKLFFRTYLKLKANHYHSKMVDFLSELQPHDEIKWQVDKAIEQEKIFREVFENPSDRVVETELAKIQLKWLSNDFLSTTNVFPGRDKAKGAFRDFLEKTKEYQKQATGIERKYFDEMVSHFCNFIEFQWLHQCQDLPLRESDNILRVILKNAI